MIRLTIYLLLLCILSACGSAPTMTWRATVTDAATGAEIAADIYVDNACVAHSVTRADIDIPADGGRHALRVEAAGYQRWEIQLAGETAQRRVVRGPVKLQRK